MTTAFDKDPKTDKSNTPVPSNINRMMLEKNSPVRTLVGSLRAFNQLASGKIANLRILHYVSLTPKARAKYRNFGFVRVFSRTKTKWRVFGRSDFFCYASLP
jgi:hypothetical protein